MTDYTLTYFDMSASRGEEVRLAFTLAGVPFHDTRIQRETWPALKPETPFASLPMLDIEGHGRFGQSNALLRLIGRRHGLYPEDIYEAAHHDALMDFAEDLRHRISPTMRIADPDQRKAARQALTSDTIPQWGRCVERLLGDGPFTGGTKPGVADIKLFVMDKWLSSGILDDIPASVLDGYPRLKTLTKAFAAHPPVAARLAAQRA